MKVCVFAQVPLAEVVCECMEALRPQADVKQLTLAIASTPELSLVAVRAEMEIIFNNLITNAIKYNRKGGEVEVTLGKRDEMFEIAVRDTGLGLTREEAAKLFNDFVRIKNAKTRGIEGSGLGLATVKRVAALYHGDAWVSSEPDKGSTFTVTLKSEPPEKVAPP